MLLYIPLRHRHSYFLRHSSVKLKIALRNLLAINAMNFLLRRVNWIFFNFFTKNTLLRYRTIIDFNVKNTNKCVESTKGKRLQLLKKICKKEICKIKNEDEGEIKEERDQSGCRCIPPFLPCKKSLVLCLACSCAFVSDHVSRGFSMCPSRVRQLNSHTQHRRTRHSRIRRVWSRRWVPGATQVGPN